MTHTHQDISLLAHARARVDRFFGWLLAGHWLLALALAPLHGEWAVVAGGLLAGVPFALTRLRAGTLSTRLVVSAAMMSFSALFIHEGHGLTEMHFHVFVGLAFLVAYRDWRAPCWAR